LSTPHDHVVSMDFLLGATRIPFLLLEHGRRCSFLRLTLGFLSSPLCGLPPLHLDRMGCPPDQECDHAEHDQASPPVDRAHTTAAKKASTYSPPLLPPSLQPSPLQPLLPPPPRPPPRLPALAPRRPRKLWETPPRTGPMPPRNPMYMPISLLSGPSSAAALVRETYGRSPKVT